LLSSWIKIEVYFKGFTDYMKKKVTSIVLLFISIIGLASCANNSDYYINQLETNNGIEYLSEAKVEYFYKNISGLDSAGIYYYVLKYEEEPLDFLQQFEGTKSDQEPDESFQEGPNLGFQEKVDVLLQTFMKEDYDNLESEYKINWDKEYLYKNDTPDYVTFPMVYFKNEFRLIIVQQQQ